MAPEAANQSNTQFARFLHCGFLVIQAALATATIGAFASTTPSWNNANSTVVQPPIAVEKSSNHLSSYRAVTKDLQGTQPGNCGPDNPEEEQPEVRLDGKEPDVEKVIDENHVPIVRL